MKKLSLVISAAVCFALASCGGNKTETPATTGTDTTVVKKECQKQDKDKCCSGMTEEQKKECAEFKAKWDNWANLTDVEKKELIGKGKACFDKKKAQMEEMEAKMKAKKAEIDAQFAKWDKLSLDEQKALLDKVSECCKAQKSCGDMQGCAQKGDKKECCDEHNDVHKK